MICKMQPFRAKGCISNKSIFFPDPKSLQHFLYHIYSAAVQVDQHVLPDEWNHTCIVLGLVTGVCVPCQPRTKSREHASHERPVPSLSFVNTHARCAQLQRVRAIQPAGDRTRRKARTPAGAGRSKWSSLAQGQREPDAKFACPTQPLAFFSSRAARERGADGERSQKLGPGRRSFGSVGEDEQRDRAGLERHDCVCGLTCRRICLFRQVDR